MQSPYGTETKVSLYRHSLYLTKYINDSYSWLIMIYQEKNKDLVNYSYFTVLTYRFIIKKRWESECVSLSLDPSRCHGWLIQRHQRASSPIISSSFQWYTCSAIRFQRAACSISLWSCSGVDTVVLLELLCLPHFGVVSRQAFRLGLISDKSGWLCICDGV